MANIGEPLRTIIVEPLKEPVPQREMPPADVPTPQRQPEKVPA